MFAQIETWIFDLGNTLYHPSARLFDQINARMTGFIMRELGVSREAANALRQRYWDQHGATLRGLIDEHGIDPARFLDDVHTIDLSTLTPDADLAEAVRRLPGTRMVHTNGARAHVERVLAARGLSGTFDAIYAIEDKALVPKPRPDAYRRIVQLSDVDPARAVMIEDDVRNLEVPMALGMATVWLCHGQADPPPPYVDRQISGLTAFLQEFV